MIWMTHRKTQGSNLVLHFNPFENKHYMKFCFLLFIYSPNLTMLKWDTDDDDVNGIGDDDVDVDDNDDNVDGDAVVRKN